MKAVLGTTVVAQAPTEDLIKIEGNWYFPPAGLTVAFDRRITVSE